MFNVCKLYDTKVGIISIDHEKAFDERIDHGFLFSMLQAFDVGVGFCSRLNYCTLKLVVL